METIKVHIPKLTIADFRKLADKCKKNIPGFDYSVGDERNERFAHLVDVGEGRHIEYMMHPIFPVEITMPDDNGWQLLATYKDGYEYITNSSKKLILSNPEHGKDYGRCDVCGHRCYNSFLIRNTTTGEELQVGGECVKKFGLNFTQALSKLTASLYADYIIDYKEGFDDMDCPIWRGEPDRYAFSVITKACLICAAKAYYDEYPTWIKGYRENGCYRKSESNSAIQRLTYDLKDSAINEEYVKTICDYALSIEADSEFTDNMHRIANDYYASPADAVYAFFMVKQYEDMMKAKALDMDRFKQGIQLHVTGEIIDTRIEDSFYGMLTIHTIKTNSGLTVKRTGKVPYSDKDGVKSVDFYALVKYVKGIEIVVDRACKNAKKGIETIAV